MPYRKRRFKRLTMGKEPIKHSATLISTIGNGSNVGQRTLITTNAGNRSLDGSATTIRAQNNTSINVQVGDIVKYVNITLQTAITEAGQTQQDDTQGWLEWAVVWRDEVDIPIPATNLGIQHLGDLAMQMFRGDCIMTGQFPCSVNLPNLTNITIKLPKKAIKYKLGCVLSIYTHFRSSNVTDLTTDTVRLVEFHHFKSYS